MGTILEPYKLNLVAIDYEEIPSGCWECISHAKISTGYIRISRNGKQWLLHRYVYELLVGAIGEGMSICHTCDNKICCNPKHLFQGTQQDNMADMYRKHGHWRQRRARILENNNRIMNGG